MGIDRFPIFYLHPLLKTKTGLPQRPLRTPYHLSMISNPVLIPPERFCGYWNLMKKNRKVKQNRSIKNFQRL